MVLKTISSWFRSSQKADPQPPIETIPSILLNYEWTGKFPPFAHQKETAAFLSARQRAFCFNEQGTGKTASVIWAADYLMKIGKVKRVLVLCPLSIMRSAWEQDLRTFAKHRSCSVAHGDTAQANARIDRAGQKNAMTIVHIKGSPVEDRLYSMLQGNLANHERLIDLYRSVLTAD